MASFLSRRIGPEPSATRMALALNAIGIGLAIWCFLRPNAVSGAGCLAAPLVAIAIARLDPRFSMMAEQPGSQADIGGLWFPVLVIALQVSVQQKMMTPLAPLLAALPLAILLFGVLTKADFEAKVTARLAGTLALCLAWAWGGVIFANITFDPSPPERMSGTVLETHKSRGGQRMTVSTQYAGEPMVVEGLRTAGHQVGSPVYMEMRDGRFGWRYLRVLDR